VGMDRDKSSQLRRLRSRESFEMRETSETEYRLEATEGHEN
jgi:hypothetical protein